MPNREKNKGDRFYGGCSAPSVLIDVWQLIFCFTWNTSYILARDSPTHYTMQFLISENCWGNRPNGLAGISVHSSNTLVSTEDRLCNCYQIWNLPNMSSNFNCTTLARWTGVDKAWAAKLPWKFPAHFPQTPLITDCFIFRDRLNSLWRQIQNLMAVHCLRTSKGGRKLKKKLFCELANIIPLSIALHAVECILKSACQSQKNESFQRPVVMIIYESEQNQAFSHAWS